MEHFIHRIEKIRERFQMNLGIISCRPDSATSFYRAYGPLSKLSRSHDVRLITYDRWGWPELMQCDVVFMQRPYDVAHCGLVKLAKKIGTKVWIDYDDLDTEPFPLAHPANAEMSSPQVQESLRWLMENADVVTVSTAFLASRLSEYCDAIVIPNAWDGDIFPFSDLTREKVISWRGGPANGHNQDLEQALKEIRELVELLPDWRWIFFGQPHWQVENIIPQERLAIVPQMPFLEYMSNLIRCKPSVHIVPLADNNFNRAKSNCSWIEASIAGAVTVAQNWLEFERPGISTYVNGDMSESVMRAIKMSMPIDSRAWINANISIRAINEKRFGILKDLCR